MTSRGFGRRSRWDVWRPFILLLLFASLCVGAILWSLPTGTGEYQSAPNNKYTAHLSHLSRGTWRGRRADYAEATVVDAQTGKVLWHMQYEPTGTTLPDYGDREKHFIQWVGDSSSVTFFLGSGGSANKTTKQKITVPVP